MSKVIDIDGYNPSGTDKFFFDNNIWMYYFCPVGNYQKRIIKKYAGFLKKIVTAKAKIFVSSLVLSEFFNAYVRLEYKILKDKKRARFKNFKRDFRNTSRYEKLVKDIKTTVKGQILKLAKRLDDQFKSIDIDAVFTDIEKHDFNDKYFMELSVMNDLIIVTDDGDFFDKGMDFQVITANKKLLNKGKRPTGINL